MQRPSGKMGRLSGTVLLVGILLGPLGPVTPASVVATHCPAPPVTAEKVITAFNNSDALACFGGRLLTFRAFVQRPEGIGGTSATAISPDWLNGMASEVILGSSPTSASMSGFVPPDLGDCSDVESRRCPFHWYVGRWTTVSGHFDGPVAQTCRIASQPPSEHQTKQDAIEYCRQLFIVLGVGVPPLPETSVASADPAGSVPPPLALLAGGMTFLLLFARGRRRARG